MFQLLLIVRFQDISDTYRATAMDGNSNQTLLKFFVKSDSHLWSSSRSMHSLNFLLESNKRPCLFQAAYQALVIKYHLNVLFYLEILLFTPLLFYRFQPHLKLSSCESRSIMKHGSCKTFLLFEQVHHRIVNYVILHAMTTGRNILKTRLEISLQCNTTSPICCQSLEGWRMNTSKLSCLGWMVIWRQPWMFSLVQNTTQVLRSISLNR